MKPLWWGLSVVGTVGFCHSSWTAMILYFWVLELAKSGIIVVTQLHCILYCKIVRALLSFMTDSHFWWVLTSVEAESVRSITLSGLVDVLSSLGWSAFGLAELLTWFSTFISIILVSFYSCFGSYCTSGFLVLFWNKSVSLFLLCVLCACYS